MTDYLTDIEAVVIIDGLGFRIRDLGLLLSALGRPKASVFGADAYPDVLTKAAALAESLARNHPLVDGNKRTALVLTATFLQLNGWRLRPSPEHVGWLVAVASGQVDLAYSVRHLTAWVERAD